MESMVNHVNAKADEYRKAGYKVYDVFFGASLSHFTTTSPDGKVRRHTFRKGMQGMEHLGDTGVTSSGENTVKDSGTVVKRGRGRPKKNTGASGSTWVWPKELAAFTKRGKLPAGRMRTIKAKG